MNEDSKAFLNEMFDPLLCPDNKGNESELRSDKTNQLRSILRNNADKFDSRMVEMIDRIEEAEELLASIDAYLSINSYINIGNGGRFHASIKQFLGRERNG